MKKRHYTLQQMGDSLCLTIKGKFLNQEFGLQAGDYFQLISQGDQLILSKQTKQLKSAPSSTKLPKQAPANRVSWQKNGQIVYSSAKF